jgi:putative DNA primase/helicase
VSQGLAYHAALTYLTSNVPGDKTPPTVRWRCHYYQWGGALYRPVTDEVLEADLTRWLARNPAARDEGGKVRPVTKTFLRDAMLAVRSETTIGDEILPGTWLNTPPAGATGPFVATPGGILDLGQVGDAGAAIWPSNANFFTLASLPVTPDAAAGCPKWLSFLAETFPAGPEAVRLLQEVFGYCLWPGCDYERFVIIHGGGKTGKSTIGGTLQALLGEGNVGALPLERFGERFALAGLVGKLANVVFDASEIDRTAEGTLKALVSGEPVTVEHKHAAVTSMRLLAKQIFITNVLPRFHETSNGLWRRLTLIPCDSVCPDDRCDVDLKAKLREELPGIAHWALQGLARLRQQGGFTVFEGGTVRAAEYRQESNPVAVFVSAECVAEPDGRVGRRVLYAAYRQWATANGHAPLSSTKFYGEVRALVPQPAEEVRDGRGGDRVFVGVRLREDPDVVHQFKLLAGDRAEGA